MTKIVEEIKNRKKRIFDEFCSINGSYWEESDCKKKDETVLVEGLFAESGPNYVIRIGIIAKAMEKVKNANLLVLLRLSDKKEPYKKQVWQSFKMNNFIGIYDDVYYNFSLFKKLQIKLIANIYYMYSKLLFKLNIGRFFPYLSFKGVRIGDILYDDIIKETPVGVFTIDKITKMHRKFFERLFVYFYVSEFIYNKYKLKYYVTTHIQYISYGLPARYFAHQGVVVIETTDDLLFIYENNSPGNYPRYHSEMNRMIKNIFDKLYDDEKIQEQAKLTLNERLTGNINQIDAKMAYADKQNYSKEDLKEKLGINNDNPIVFIFAHIFSDTPQGASNNMLFSDFYQWLVETIKYIRKVNDINWIVKPHPSSKSYSEEGEVAKLIKKYCNSESSVYLCPDDFSTAGVLNSATAIVTVMGTVGLEYSCCGIPIVVCAEAFYSGFGFTQEPKNRKEYFKLLKNINQLKPLEESQKRAARVVYMLFSSFQNKDFALIDVLLKDKTWGCTGDLDILGAFELMSERLKTVNPKTRPLYTEMIEYFSRKD